MANWRQEIELLQNYPKHKTFTFTTSSGSAETALNIAANFEEVNKISFVVELADAYIAFDETDEFAHDIKYDNYLYAIKRLDNYIENLWLWLQSQDNYKNKTTLIITTDHGRGKYLNDKWGSHWARYAIKG